MKQTRYAPQNCGYRLTSDGLRILQENRPAPFQFTHEGAAQLLDHKRGLIAADVNILPTPNATNKPYACPPLSKGEQLEILMDCGERLHKRFQAAYRAIHALPESDYKGRNAAYKKLTRVQNASNRLTRKITDLLTGKESLLLPSPTLCLPKLKNSELKKLQAQYEAKWREFWDSDLELTDTDYSEISEMLNHINDEIERRQERGLA